LIISHFTQFFSCAVDVGLSGVIPDNSWIGKESNSYAISSDFYFFGDCQLAGERHHFELPEGAIQPEEKEYGNVYGCGLILDPDNNLAIFFTLNGQLLGELVQKIFRVFTRFIFFCLKGTLINGLIIINLHICRSENSNQSNGGSPLSSSHYDARCFY
jgi:hypothetical protein